MSELRDSVYRHIPSQTLAPGYCRVVHRHGELWAQYQARIAQQVVAELFPHIPFDFDELLQEGELTDQALIGDNFFSSRAPSLKMPARACSKSRALEIERKARDLADDEGTWRRMREPLADALADARAHLEERIRALVGRLRVDVGPSGARRFVLELRRRMESLRSELSESTTEWTAARATALRKSGALVGALARRRAPAWMVWMAVPFLRHDRRVVRTNSDERLIKKALRDINEAARIRLARDERESRLRLLDAFLGTDTRSGYLDKVEARLDRDAAFFADLPEKVAPIASSHDGSLALVEDLDAPLERDGETLGQVFSRLTREAGFSPARLARQLTDVGVEIDGGRVRASAWPRHDLSRVRSALRAEVSRALGSDIGPDTPIRFGDPTASPFARAAALTFGAPELEHLAQQKIADAADRAAPYLEVPSFEAARRVRRRYVFCHPAVRPHVSRWLRAKGPTVTARGEDPRYDLRNPHVVEIATFGLCYPGQAQDDFTKAVFEGLRLRSAPGASPRMFKRDRWDELRILDRRPSDYQDAEKLFHALRNADAIRSLGGRGDRWAFRRGEPALDHHFYVMRHTPRWLSPSSVRELMRDEAFQEFVEMTPSLRPRDWDTLVLRLANEPDASAVARGLGSAGVLEEGGAGTYRVAGGDVAGSTPPPPAAYELRRGELQGLAADAFVALLLEDDPFYNAAFWRAADALVQGRLKRHQATQFVRDTVDRVISR